MSAITAIVSKVIMSVLIAGSVLPYWADGTRVACDDGCGACGAVQESYAQILSYDKQNWVPVCDQCFLLFVTEDYDHRQCMELEVEGL